VTGNRPRMTTKTFNPMDEGADSGLPRDRVLRQIETSLERLGVDSVDLYLAHEYDPGVPISETIGAFEELVGAGVVAEYGVSNFDASQLAAAVDAGRPALVQNSYSLLERGDEADVVPLCSAHGVRYQAFSPLAGGWLAGRYRRGQSPPVGSRMTMRPGPYLHLDVPRVYDGLESLAAEGERRGVSSAGLALAWVVASPGVDSAVVGPRRPGHLEPVREAVGLQLDEPEHEALASLFD
jgi:1-deoxyxylulose-5-phosphate synthase